MMKKGVSGAALAALVAVVGLCACALFAQLAHADDDDRATYLKETFDDGDGWETRWVRSEAKKEGVSEAIAKYDGKWVLKRDTGNGGDERLVMDVANKHYGLSRRLEKPINFANLEEDLYVQYEVKFEEPLECGGAYMKLLSDTKDLDLKQLTDTTPYTILFGPDKCGASSHLRFIYRFKHPVKGEYFEVHARPVEAAGSMIFNNRHTNLVTLILRPDNSFSIRINDEEVSRGKLPSKEDFDPALMPERTIDDPDDFKPEDWDDREMIDDPEDVKPDDWDEDAPPTIPDMTAEKPEEWDESQPEYIPDPEAEKPADWDDEEDGEWEAPLVPNPACDTGCGPWQRPTIANPAYKGKWQPRQIKNPNYKGEWSPRQIDNPDFFEERDPFHKLAPIGAAAFELWTVSRGISFSNILITTYPEAAEDHARAWREKRRDEDMEAGDAGVLVHAQLLFEEMQDNPTLAIAATVVVGGVIALLCLRTPTADDGQDQQQQRGEGEQEDAEAEQEEEQGEAEEGEEQGEAEEGEDGEDN